jgi:hypothetical protein
MILGGAMALVSMHFEHQRRRLWHETARLAIEKGQPIPPHPDEPKPTRRDAAQRDLRAGLVLIAVGAGTYIFLQAVSDARVANLGLIPGLMGVALVLHWIISRRLGASHRDSSSSDA